MAETIDAVLLQLSGFLFGAKSVNAFRVLHLLICASGALVSVQVMWDAADVANGLMALPNLLSLFLFSGIVVKDSKVFFEKYDKAHGNKAPIEK